MTRAFYHGLAALEVGLLDDARQQFASATERVPEEPASWANLGLTRLRLGELDAAAEPIERALSLTPGNADLVLLAGRMEIARGRLDEGVAHLRRAVQLQPRALRARFALADEVERAAAPDADAQAMMLLDELAQLAPNNPAIHVERARLAAKVRDALKLNQTIGNLEPIAVAWPERALEQFRALRMAAIAGDLQRAQLTTIFLRNVLASVPSFIESLAAVRTPTELIAEPIDRFIRLPPPVATPSAPDLELTFEAETIAATTTAPSPLAVVLSLPSGDERPPRLFGGSSGEMAELTGPSVRSPFELGTFSGQGPSRRSLVAIDWNNDFRTDIVMAGAGGIRLLIQDAEGSFSDRTPASGSECVCYGAWSADLEMDGDLDLVAGAVEGGVRILRNNGDGSWTAVTLFDGVTRVRGFAWADLDQDGDPDALFLDAESRLYAFANRRAGDFVRFPGFPDVASAVAVEVADLDADGAFDVVVLDRTGKVQRLSRGATRWNMTEVAAWQGLQTAAGSHDLMASDLDNNGAVDLVATGSGQSRIWLSDERHQLRALETAPAATVFPAGDLDGDGRIDLIGVMGRTASGAERAVRLLNRGTKSYHWKIVRPRAQTSAGDQRINSFGVGGDIEVRSGLLLQKQLLTGGPVHIGLGDRTAIDVARIVWPNGVAQAEFGTDVDNVLVAEQRLKGSCPWIFAWDGRRMAFVTDFLWRSPLGLRINAQDTAGVVQTEDWVKISGDRLAPRNGSYDIRIAAELWETHFFDHVSLMVVDHPPSTEIFVDERFSAAAPPALRVHVVEDRRPVTGVRDDRGNDVTAAVAQKDGTYLATFEKGAYQGIAAEHFVEFDFDGRPERAVLLASGWIYPTDSSINVAIGQGGDIRPMGLSLEAQGGDGRWRIVDPDLGFPAGKNKTVVIDLARVGDARRLRLRTNLEIYWDALELGTVADVALRTTTLQVQRAMLRYRGFSETTSPRGDAPETPNYDRIATKSQRWRDLVGYHTRFGDVNELLGAVDDRYVIMNAGDELQLLFDEQPASRDGWQRDFVLVGDGWEKDGDFNTSFSQTVLPLPSHDRPAYGTGVTSLELEDDPVYQRHKEDWQRYHTRYVTPRAFVDGLRH